MVCPQCHYSNEQGLMHCVKCSTPLPLDDPTLTEDTLDVDRPPAEPSEQGLRQLTAGMILAERYEIVRLLGQGGMGAVYQARDRELDRTVALKIIRMDRADSREASRRFKQETILARQITHRNVIRIFDLAHADGIQFITMEYIEGESLQRFLLRRKKLEPQEAAKIMAQICAALEAAHAEGVIHRDLKPQNIMLDPNGRVYVMDFGIARSIDSRMTRTGAIIGTPDYMSPEQAKGVEIDTRSDIFSAGIIFYEMLTGRSPFQADTAMGKLWKRTSEPAPDIHEIDTSIPRALSEIVKKCLEIEPEKRFASATELLRAVELWQGPAAINIVSAPVPRYVKGLIGTLVLMIAVLAFLVGHRILRRPAPPHPTVSLLIADFDNKTGDAVFDGTLEPILSLALEGAPFISSYNRGEARKVASRIKPDVSKLDAPIAEVVAIREGVNAVLAGAIRKEGSSYRVSIATLDPATDKPVLKYEEIYAADKQSVLGATGQLAERIRKGLGDTSAGSALQSGAETYTAGSLEAAHAYAVGQALQQQGKWPEAIKAYNHAIELDPEMGRAYAGAAVMYANLGERQEAEKSYQLAMTRIDRMTDREKYRTRGAYYLWIKNPAKAIDEYGALVKQFPADTAGHPNLALAYFLQRDMVKALEEQEKVIAATPNSVLQRSNLSLYALYAGEFEMSGKEAQQTVRDNPTFETGARTLGLAKFATGHIEEARQAYDNLQSMSPRGAAMAATCLADLALYEGRSNDAVALLKQVISANLEAHDSESAANNHVTLAQVQLSLGKRTEAEQLAAKSSTASNDDSVLYRSAQVFLGLGQQARAEHLIAPLGSRLESDPQMYAKLIAGEALLGHGRPRDALTIFQQAQKISDSWLVHFDLGQAYLDTGAFGEAASEFELCLKRRGEATAVFLDDLPTYHLLPPVYYYLGRAREALGSAEASESYQAFLAIKQKADADPLVSDARKRLQNLSK